MKTVSLLTYELLLFTFVEEILWGFVDDFFFCWYTCLAYLKGFCCIKWQQFITLATSRGFPGSAGKPREVAIYFYLLNSKFTIRPSSGFVVNVMWGLFWCVFVNFICLIFFLILDGCIGVISTVLNACLIFVVVGSPTWYFVLCARTY